MTDEEPPRPSAPGARPAFRIGDWDVYPSLNRLDQGGRSVRIEPRLMHVLVELASRPGEVISRDALLGSVWGEAVVGEETLTVAISELRRILAITRGVRAISRRSTRAGTA